MFNKWTKKVLKILFTIAILLLSFIVIELVFLNKKNINIEASLSGFEVLDVNYKVRANKLAADGDVESNGWYASKNIPQEGASKHIGDSLFLKLDEDEFTLIENRYVANKLYLVNNSDSSKCFHAQDSRLNIVMQAKNIFGFWQDIETLPDSWCGNSYHEICLEKGMFWEFESLQFKGRHRTKLRYVLMNDMHELISNEINGYVNTGQFFEFLRYTPSSLMDPYDY